MLFVVKAVVALLMSQSIALTEAAFQPPTKLALLLAISLFTTPTVIYASPTKKRESTPPKVSSFFRDMLPVRKKAKQGEAFSENSLAFTSSDDDNRPLPPSYVQTMIPNTYEIIEADTWHRHGPVPKLAHTHLQDISLKEILEVYPQYALWYIAQGVGKDALYSGLIASLSRSRYLLPLLKDIIRLQQDLFIPDHALYDAVENCYNDYSNVIEGLVSLGIKRLFQYQGSVGSPLDLAYERFSDEGKITKMLRGKGSRTAAELQLKSLHRDVGDIAIGAQGYLPIEVDGHDTYWSKANAYLLDNKSKYASEAPASEELFEILPLRVIHLAHALANKVVTQQELDNLLLIFSAERVLHRYVPWLLSMGADIHQLLERLKPATVRYRIPSFFLPPSSIADLELEAAPNYLGTDALKSSPLHPLYKNTARPFLVELLWDLYGTELKMPVAHLAAIFCTKDDNIEHWKEVLSRLQSRPEWNVAAEYDGLTPLDWLIRNQQSQLRIWYRDHEPSLPQRLNEYETFMSDATFAYEENASKLPWFHQSPSLLAGKEPDTFHSFADFFPRSIHPAWPRLIKEFQAKYDKSRKEGTYDPLKLTGETWGSCSIEDRTQLLTPMLLDPQYYQHVLWMIAHGASISGAGTVLFSHKSSCVEKDFPLRAKLFEKLCQLCNRELQYWLGQQRNGIRYNDRSFQPDPLLHVLVQSPGDDIYALDVLIQTKVAFNINIRRKGGNTALDLTRNKPVRAAWLERIQGRRSADIAKDKPNYKYDKYGLPILLTQSLTQKRAYEYLKTWATSVDYNPDQVKRLRSENRKHTNSRNYHGQWADTDQSRDRRNYKEWKREQPWHKWKMQFPGLKSDWSRMRDFLGGRQSYELNPQGIFLKMLAAMLTYMSLELRQLVITSATEGYHRNIPILVYYGADLNGVLSEILRHHYKPEIVMMLYKLGGPTVLRSDDLSLAQLACLNFKNSTKLLDTVLQEAPTLLNALHKSMTLLDVALSSGKPEIITYLMSRGAQPGPIVSQYLWKFAAFNTEPEYESNIGDKEIWAHVPYILAAFDHQGDPPNWLESAQDIHQTSSFENLPLFDPTATQWGRKVFEILAKNLDSLGVRQVLGWAPDDAAAQAYANIIFDCPKWETSYLTKPYTRSETLLTQVISSMYSRLPEAEQPQEVLEELLLPGVNLLETLVAHGAITCSSPLELDALDLPSSVVHDRSERLAEAFGQLGRYNMTNPNMPILLNTIVACLFPRISFLKNPQEDMLEMTVTDDLASAKLLAAHEIAVRHFMTYALHAAVESGAHQSHLVLFLLQHGAEPWQEIRLRPDSIDCTKNRDYEHHYSYGIARRYEYSPDKRGDTWCEARGIKPFDKSEEAKEKRNTLFIGYQTSVAAIELSIKQASIHRVRQVIKAAANGASQDRILLSQLSGDKQGRLPLIAAIQDEQTDLALELCKFACIQDTLNREDLYVTSWSASLPLISACSRGNFLVVSELLKHGAELLPQAEYSSLYRAVQSGEVSVVKALISHAEKNALDSGFTLDMLVCAIQRQALDIVELLLARFFDNKSDHERTEALSVHVVLYGRSSTLLDIALEGVENRHNEVKVSIEVRRKIVRELWARMNVQFLRDDFYKTFTRACKAGELIIAMELYPLVAEQAKSDQTAESLLTTLDRFLNEAVKNKSAEEETVTWLLEKGAMYFNRNGRKKNLQETFERKRDPEGEYSFRRRKLDSNLKLMFAEAEEEGQKVRPSLEQEAARAEGRQEQQRIEEEMWAQRYHQDSRKDDELPAYDDVMDTTDSTDENKTGSSSSKGY